MIDTKELRRLAQAALTGPDGVSLNWVKLLQDFQKEANPATITELLDRLEAADKERDELRAKIEAMEKQEPICVTTKAHLAAMDNGATRFIVGRDPVFSTRGENDVPLYLAPGAQPAPSVRPAALYPVISWLRNGCDPMMAADELELLAAAPEAKP